MQQGPCWSQCASKSTAKGYTAWTACDTGLPFSTGIGPVLGIVDLVNPEHVDDQAAMFRTYSSSVIAGTCSMT
eukprot:1821027-Amphidinium_carterae.6